MSCINHDENKTPASKISRQYAYSVVATADITADSTQTFIDRSQTPLQRSVRFQSHVRDL